MKLLDKETIEFCESKIYLLKNELEEKTGLIWILDAECHLKNNEHHKINVDLKRYVKIIQTECAEAWKIPYSGITSKKRNKNIIQARQMGIHIVKQNTTLSLNQIALYFNFDNHTSVIHAVKKVENFLTLEENYRQTYVSIFEKIKHYKPVNYTP